MKIDQRLDTDFVWENNKPRSEPTHLLIYHQEEHGSATTLTGKALVGDNKPIAKIYSKYMSTGSSNFIPVPFWPEFRLYETRNNKGERFFVLRIPSAYPIELSQDRYANPQVWMHTYPIVRDIVMVLNDCGVNKMSYLTTNLFSLHRDFGGYSKVPHGQVISYNFVDMKEEVTTHYGDIIEDSEELDFIIAPNVWIWCDVFSSFCSNSPQISELLLGRGSTEAVDMDTADALLNHILLHYGLSCDESALQNLTQQLMEVDKLNNYGDEVI